MIGYCDLRAGQYALAVDAMRSAHARDPHNWRYAYGLAIAQAIAGEDPRQAAQSAVRLSRFEPLPRELARALDTDDPAKRFRAAARASLPSG
jgi:Flp pilus assembly protein TadD